MLNRGINPHRRRAEAHLRTIVSPKRLVKRASGYSHSSQTLQKIRVEKGATKFPIRNTIQAGIFLARDNVADARIFHRAQFVISKRPFLMKLARSHQLFWAEVTPDMFGSKWWFFAHTRFPLFR